MFTQSENRVKPPAPSKMRLNWILIFVKISKPIKLKMCLKKYHINTLKNAKDNNIMLYVSLGDGLIYKI